MDNSKVIVKLEVELCSTSSVEEVVLRTLVVADTKLKVLALEETKLVVNLFMALFIKIMTTTATELLKLTNFTIELIIILVIVIKTLLQSLSFLLENFLSSK
jgi:hypothetical protein